MPQLDETHDPALRSWVEGADGHPDFPIQNLPFGVVSRPFRDEGPRGAVAIGDRVLDLAALAASGLLSGEAQQACAAAAAPTLNAMFALGAGPRRALRKALSALLAAGCEKQAEVAPMLIATGEVTLHLPMAIADYTDFYVGIHHATNIGTLLRPDNPLLPNYKHVPIGYHGRASTVRPSGAEVVRPQGQTKAPDADAPRFGPIARLDYELELGVWLAGGNALASSIPIGEAADHIAGLTLLNDWSARDVQAWEYQPLGPFLAKSFLTTVSPWIVTPEALAPFRIAQPPRPSGDPAPLAYLMDEHDQSHGALALDLTVTISTRRMREAGEAPHVLSRGTAATMYWTMAQMITHHASNGCMLQTGDLLGTGTLSGPGPGSEGSLMEISKAGREPIALPGGETRTFLEDGDEIVLAGRFAAEGAIAIGFGPCTGTVRG